MNLNLLSPFLSLLLLTLPALITAQCDACKAYTSALSTCQKSAPDKTNVTAMGDTMDTDTVKCMCSTHSNSQQINTCNGCWTSNPTTDFDIQILLAWSTTCKADGKFDEEQAVLCWEGYPLNSLPCFQRDGSGGSGGGDVPTGLGNSPLTSATQASSPSASAKSGAANTIFANVGLLTVLALLGIASGL